MKISIITVCLNSEATIEQTMQSVLVQKNKNIEYIIVDGKSTDRTFDIINKYKDRIDIIISEPDHGIYDAINKGISLATGDVIGIINSDDWYESDTLDKIQKCFCDSDADIVYGKLNLVDEDGGTKLLIPNDIGKIRYEMMIPHPTAFVKRSIYEKHGTFSVKYTIAADYDLMLRYYTRGVKFVYLDELLASFRLSGISNKQSKICAYETIAISKRYLPYYSAEEREYVKKIIDDRWNPFLFRQLLDEFQVVILEYIKNRLQKEVKSNISIFGAGKWGKDIFSLLSRNNLSPLLLIDNNKKMWGKLLENKAISPPDMLKSFDGILLILAKDFSEEILSQVKSMDNPMIICITWEELVDELKDHILPG